MAHYFFFTKKAIFTILFKKRLEKNEKLKYFHTSISHKMLKALLENPVVKKEAEEAARHGFKAVQNLSSTQVTVIAAAAGGLVIGTELYTSAQVQEAHDKVQELKTAEIKELEKEGRVCGAELKSAEKSRAQNLFDKDRFHGVVTGFLSHRWELRSNSQKERDAFDQKTFDTYYEGLVEREKAEREAWMKQKETDAEIRRKKSEDAARRIYMANLSYTESMVEHGRDLYSKPAVKNGVDLLCGQLGKILLEKGLEAMKMYFSSSIDKGITGSGKNIEGGDQIGSPFEERHGLVSQTYDLLLLIYTTFEGHMEENLERLKEEHGSYLTQEIVDNYFKLNPFTDSNEYHMVLDYLLQQQIESELADLKQKSVSKGYHYNNDDDGSTGDSGLDYSFANPGEPGQSSSGSSDYRPESPLRRTDSKSDIDKLAMLDQIKRLELQNEELLERVANPELRNFIRESELLKMQKRDEYLQKDADRREKDEFIKSNPGHYTDDFDKKKEKKD